MLIFCINMTEGYGFNIVRDCKNVKKNYITIKLLHTNARFGFPFRAHYSGVYMGANTQFCQVSDSDSSRLESHFLYLDSSRDSEKNLT